MTDRWLVAAASRIGALHVRGGSPCQDAFATWQDEDTGCAVLAVADGHGHPLHSRSEVGARIAADVTVQLLSTEIATLDSLAAANAALATLGPRVVEGWVQAVLAHAESHPIGASAEASADAPTTDKLLPYGTTILGLAASPQVVVVLQLGDGDAVLVSPSGRAFRPLPPDPDLQGQHTTSLCQPDPLRSFRSTAVRATTDTALGFLCTDGFGSPQLDSRGWWHQVGSQLHEHVRERGFPWVAERLSEWLVEPATVGGDDTTLGVAALTQD